MRHSADLLFESAAAELLHVAQERLEGKPLAVYVAEADRKAFRDILSSLLKRAISGANVWEIGLNPRAGKEVRVSITVSPVVPLSAAQLPSGKEGMEGVGLRWSLRDISERKRAEQEIQHHVDALRSANAELTQFNNTMVGRELRMIELKKRWTSCVGKPGWRGGITQAATPMDFEVTGAGSMQEALGLLASGRFSAVLLDLNLPDNSGMEGIDKIRATPEAPPVIVLIGLTNPETGLQVLAWKTQDYLIKGKFDTDILVRSIRYAIERDRAEKTVRQMKAELESRVVEQYTKLQPSNQELEQREAARTAELQAANESLRASRLAALNIMEDALAAHAQAVNDRKRLQALMEALPVGVAYVDNRGTRFETNKAFEEIWAVRRCPPKSSTILTITGPGGKIAAAR